MFPIDFNAHANTYMTISSKKHPSQLFHEGMSSVLVPYWDAVTLGSVIMCYASEPMQRLYPYYTAWIGRDVSCTVNCSIWASCPHWQRDHSTFYTIDRCFEFFLDDVLLVCICYC